MARQQTEVSGEALRKQTEERAYSIWEAEGKCDGCDLEHWLRAETEISATLTTKAERNIGKPATKSTARAKKA